MTIVPEPLDLGPHKVALRCPDCDDRVVIEVDLVTVRERATDRGVSLRLKAKSSKVAHLCGQVRFDLDGPE